MRPFALLLSAFLLLPTLANASTPAQASEWLTAKDPRAAAAVAALLKAQPRSAEVHVRHARLLLQQKQPGDAVDAAERAAGLDPELAQAQYWLGNAYGQQIGQIGMLRKMSIAPKLRDAFERALVLDPAIHEARINLIEYYLQAPSIAGGSVDKAKAHAAELARRDPPRGHFARGRLAMFEKDYAAAAQAYGEAWRARPENANFRMAAGTAYQANAQWAEAFQVYQAWAKEDPKAAGPQYQLGRTAALSGQFLAEGEAALRTYLAMAPDPGQPPHHHAWYRLGQVQAHAGDKVAARASLRKALEGDPGNADFQAALSAL
jgi:tetratricopeptide (TPR) repeat protein